MNTTLTNVFAAYCHAVRAINNSRLPMTMRRRYENELDTLIFALNLRFQQA